MLLDRKYSADEVAEIANRAEKAMGEIPEIVKLAAHVAAANVILSEALKFGPSLPEFQMASRALHASAKLFLLVCETGPVGTGRPQ